jgi:hypothetical protein
MVARPRCATQVLARRTATVAGRHGRSAGVHRPAARATWLGTLRRLRRELARRRTEVAAAVARAGRGAEGDAAGATCWCPCPTLPPRPPVLVAAAGRRAGLDGLGRHCAAGPHGARAGLVPGFAPRRARSSARDPHAADPSCWRAERALSRDQATGQVCRARRAAASRSAACRPATVASALGPSSVHVWWLRTERKTPHRTGGPGRTAADSAETRTPGPRRLGRNLSLARESDRSRPLSHRVRTRRCAARRTSSRTRIGSARVEGTERQRFARESQRTCVPHRPVVLVLDDMSKAPVVEQSFAVLGRSRQARSPVPRRHGRSTSVIALRVRVSRLGHEVASGVGHSAQRHG